jgi:uncharacterized protein (DUF924 family)
MTEEVPVGSWVDDILDFWLREIGPEGWWVKSAATDDAITRRFGALWQEKKALPAESFLDSREKAFAAILLFDQFSRNMFRGDARAFETDPLACAIARGALERGYDRETEEAARSFFYIPFMHSEDLDDQHLCVELFEQPGFEYNLKFAREHRDIIARFGRFPHRNSVLGRSNRPGEEEAIAAGAGW